MAAVEELGEGSYTLELVARPVEGTCAASHDTTRIMSLTLALRTLSGDGGVAGGVATRTAAALLRQHLSHIDSTRLSAR